MTTLKLLLFLFSFLEQNTISEMQKLIFQKDLSEHCRRRVVPSIFLGRQVVEANARILQFSRLDLPYSCFISIRTESGSNMVMVIILSPNEVKQACVKNSEQLLVYEMGETFGGYWGPMPDSVMKRDPLPPKVYTLKTTQFVAEEPSSIFTEEITETTEQTSPSSKKSTKISPRDYIEVEVPLLNVSIHFVPGMGRTEPLELEESFDLHNDVTPISGVEYDRKILPLVQFQLRQQAGGQRRSEDEPPKYELDIVQEFTPDLRLTLPPMNPTYKRRNHKQRYHVTRRLNFKKHRTLFHSQRHHDRHLMSETITRRMNDITKYTFPTAKTTIAKDKTQDSWQAIKDLMKKLEKTKESGEETGKTSFSVDDAMLLENISNMNHNFSVYLFPNQSIYNNRDSKYISTINDKHSKWKPTTKLAIKTTKRYYKIENPVTEEKDAMMSVKIFEDSKETSENMESEINTLSLEETRTKQNEPSTLAFETSSTSQNPSKNRKRFENTSVSETDAFTETVVFTKPSKEDLGDSKKNNKIVTGSLVGHESWENVVQAAPEMAVLLNQTVIVVEDITLGNTSDDITKEFNARLHKNKPSKRKKRDIHSIAIDNARPNSLTTTRALITTTQASFEDADMQEFAQLVELQDDELHGRVALRYLRQYVGPALFNLCDLDETTKRHVHLFNSSRIVLAITNFTLENMVIILTAARTLLSGETRCPKSQLECQVAGARVCLDSMVACDGVPNCGSFDIYDEDRLLCGSSVTLRHNVYLAAFTFLAVLLTLLYAVHYWLKRCVPKVADAFFVYTDGVENILYLDSIMHSPHDTNEKESKIVFHSHLYGDDNINDETIVFHKNMCRRFFRKLCCCFRKKEKKIDEMESTDFMRLDQRQSNKMFSFTELEISKMFSLSKEIAVQTGDSLEMKILGNIGNTLNNEPGVRAAAASYDFSFKIQDSLLTLEEPLPEERKDELSLIKFCKATRLDSIGSVSKNSIPIIKARDSKIESCEKEIRSHTYDHHAQMQPGPSKRTKKEKNNVAPSTTVGKHLRFDEVTTTILSEEFNDDDYEESNISFDRRRSVALGESSWHGSRHLETIEEAEEHLGSGKEHRHFWGTVKRKKSKKKMFFNTK